MEQHEFIWMGKKLGVPVSQDETGNTVMSLRPQIQLTHNYKKKNFTQIVFTEDQTRFTVSNKSEVESIVGLHIANEHLEQVLRKYCDENLQKA